MLEFYSKLHKSIEELGERYVSLQKDLDAKWEEWHTLFENKAIKEIS